MVYFFSNLLTMYVNNVVRVSIRLEINLVNIFFAYFTFALVYKTVGKLCNNVYKFGHFLAQQFANFNFSFYVLSSDLNNSWTLKMSKCFHLLNFNLREKLGKLQKEKSKESGWNKNMTAQIKIWKQINY